MQRAIRLVTKDGVPEPRGILEIVKAKEVIEGAGVIVRRGLPHEAVPLELVDPFLLLDVFDTSRSRVEGQAFPRHPHRGFEIITYLLSGVSGHADDLGHHTVIRGGDLQRITAGRGIWHEEGPAPGGEEPTRGLQLWINLAKRDKGVEPDYQMIRAKEIPVRRLRDAEVHVLVGEDSPVRLRTPALYYDVWIPSNGVFMEDIPPEYQGFIYVLEGGGTFGANGVRTSEGELLVLGPGREAEVNAGPDGVRFVLGAGQPHREPIHWMGPFVD